MKIGGRNDPATLLVGVSNPTTAEQLVRLSSTMAEVRDLRILLTHVVTIADQISLTTGRSSPEVVRARDFLHQLTLKAREIGVEVSALVEVARTVDEGLLAAAESHGAAMILVGYSDATGDDDPKHEQRFDRAMHRVGRKAGCDMVVAKFRGNERKRVLVPITEQTPLGLGAILCRVLADVENTSLMSFHVVPPEGSVEDARASLVGRLEGEGVASLGRLHVVSSKAPVDVILEEAGRHDLVILVPTHPPRRLDTIFSDGARTIAEGASASVLLAWDRRS